MNGVKTRLDQTVTVLLGMFCVIGSYYFFVITLDHQRATNATASQAVTTANQSLNQVKAVKVDTSKAAAASVAAQYAALAAQQAAETTAHRKFMITGNSAKFDNLDRRMRSVERDDQTMKSQIKQLQEK